MKTYGEHLSYKNPTFLLKISQNSNSPNLMKHLNYGQIQQNLASQSEIDFDNSKTLISLSNPDVKDPKIYFTKHIRRHKRS